MIRDAVNLAPYAGRIEKRAEACRGPRHWRAKWRRHGSPLPKRMSLLTSGCYEF